MKLQEVPQTYGFLLGRNAIEENEDKKDLYQEERRLFYVAMTRAKDKLSIVRLSIENSVDASYILSLYAKNAQNKSKPSSVDLESCDINKDGTVNAVDASYFLAYYAYTATNKNPVSLTDYMKKK